MSKIGVFIETADQDIKASVPGVIAAAARGGDVVGFVLDGHCDTYKDRLAEYGVTELVNLTAGDIVLAERPAAAGEALAQAAAVFGVAALLGVSSPTGNDLLARAAVALKAPLALDCLDVDFVKNSVKKSHFSGKAVATIELTGTPIVCGIRPNSFEPVLNSCDCTVTDHAVPPASDGTVLITSVDAPIFGKSDYGIIGDLFEVVPALTKELEKLG